MTEISIEPGSFRDRRGRIYNVDNRILRTVMPMAMADYQFVRDSGFVDALVADNKLVAETVVAPSILGEQGDGAELVLEHPRLPFISYPYEWSFSTLKAAALLHLDIQLIALAKDISMTDASAYNVQFMGPKPIFIDSLSFCRYTDGEYWVGHRQFCEQFINPLLLRSACGIAHNAWYRGSLEGIPATELANILPWHSRFSWNTFANVFMQARFQKSGGSSGALEKAKARKLPRIGYEQMLRSLRKWISGLKPKLNGKTTWQDYAADNSYADEEATKKRGFVAEFTKSVKPKMILDIGCNSGDYSVAALENGAEMAVGFDFDDGALEAGYRRALDQSLNFLPLHLDAANPSSNLGWAQQERRGFQERAKGDAVLALALVHHLAIAKNIPLDDCIGWLVNMAPQGVIEFVPKNDAMVQRLLQVREDIFSDYSQEEFETLLRGRARIVKTETVSASGRTLFWFSRE